MSFSRRNSRRPSSLSKRERRRAAIALESLECRQLLAGDVSVPETVIAGGIVEGTKWEDRNQNGRRDRNEPGLPGVVIYSDLNHNGTLDRGEPSTETMRDNPRTREDESGRYSLAVGLGQVEVREVVPEGFRQTFPPGSPPAADVEEDPFHTLSPRSLHVTAEPGEPIEETVSITIHPFCIRPFQFDVVPIVNNEIGSPGIEVVNHSGVQVNGCGGDTSEFKVSITTTEPGIQSLELGFLDEFDGDIHARIPVTINGPASGGHVLDVSTGSHFKGRDFGNTRVPPRTGGIEGSKWLDQNGNGQQDPGEPGLGGVLIYLDIDNDGQRDPREPTTVTSYDDPVTDFDEGGRYAFDNVRPGSYTVREVVPRGYAQTFPRIDASVLSSETGTFAGGHASDFDVTGVEYSEMGEEPAASIEMTVVWNNGCGELLDGTVSHALIGSHLLVNMTGHQTGEICTDALKPQTIVLEVPGLEQGDYTVAATLHEQSEEGTKATLGVVGELRIGPNGAHQVEVSARNVVSNVNFGNRRIFEGETISGHKWHDINGDGRRQSEEPGLAGVTIYLDVDNNGQWNEGEPITQTLGQSEDAPEQLGSYRFEGLLPGIYNVREIVPEGFQQTFPRSPFHVPFPDLPFELPPRHDGLIPVPERFGGHHVVLAPGQQARGLDFGNQSTQAGEVRGLKWLDENGNRRRDEDEPGLSGVIIYSDLNNNGRLDENEPHVVTADDDANTLDDETGSYALELRPGHHTIREIVPDGFEQMFPVGFGINIDPPFTPTWPIPGIPDFLHPGGHSVRVTPGQTIEGLNFGNRKTQPGSIHGLKWRDDNGNGEQEGSEPGLAGVTIFVDLNFNGRLDADEPFTTTATDDDSTTEDETGRYSFEGLTPNQTYHIREIVPDGFRQTFPHILPWITPGIPEIQPGVPVAPPIDGFLPPFGQHVVHVTSGQAVHDRNFGNQPIAEPGVLRGTAWSDNNGDGMRDLTERGLPGVTVFVDYNLNGRLDVREPRATTQRDNPQTVADEAGNYELHVAPGSHLVMQQLPRGAEQTHPNPLREIIFPFNLGHSVTVETGKSIDDLDFGSRRDPSRPGVLSGIVWMDDNGNGVMDRGEAPQSGVTVYLDENNNGRRDAGEKSVISGNGPRREHPIRLLPDTGFFAFEVKPGDYVVRQETPRHFAQTFPYGSLSHEDAEGRDLPGGVATGLRLMDISVGTTSPNDNGESPVLFTFETSWPDSKWQTEEIDVQVVENTVHVTLFASPVENGSEEPVVDRTTVSAGPLPLGDYKLTAVLVEQHPNVEPQGDIESYVLETNFAFRGDDAHRVTVEAGHEIGGLNFGNIATPRQPNGADSGFGQDPHPGERNERATKVEFQNGHLRLNSFVDQDDDVDVFQFIGNGKMVEGEGGRSDGSEAVRFEILDAAGLVMAKSEAGNPLQTDTEEGETYYLRVSGAQGQYMLDLFEQDRGNEQTTDPPDRREGDINGDGSINFADFIILSSNYGQAVDQAFADGDVDGDQQVTFSDFIIVSRKFGT